jgi:hypoxanthine-guanine phosphoribosyltransferase
MPGITEQVVSGKDVLIVEDIFDSGMLMDSLHKKINVL